MDKMLPNNENYLQSEMWYRPNQENTSVDGKSKVASIIEVPGGASMLIDRIENEVSAGDSSIEEEAVDLENGSESPNWLGDEDSTGGSSLENDDHQVEESSSDDDRGGDFTVSKYMQSKISREDEARFGVWKVERAEAQPGSNVESCVSRWEVASTSHSTVTTPPLRLTLRKSQQGSGPEEPVDKIEKKHRTKPSPSEPQDPQKRRPGRPPTKNPSVSTRQRLMNMFKKKYFKDRKRWARSKSNCSMPPTIRSIAKP